jgi:membrane fusion protein, multidrug efflux system
MTAYVSIDTRRTRQLSNLFGGGPAVAANPATEADTAK